MSKSDGGGGFITLALLAGGAYLVYQWLQPSTTAAQASATPAAPPNPAAPAATSPAKPTGPSADAIYQQLVGQLTANVPAFAQNPGSFTATPYGFKFWLDKVMTLPGSLDFTQVFGPTVMADDKSAQMTLGTFCGVMSPWLKQNAGLSGLGFAGLVLMKRRRA